MLMLERVHYWVSWHMMSWTMVAEEQGWTFSDICTKFKQEGHQVSAMKYWDLTVKERYSIQVKRFIYYKYTLSCKALRFAHSSRWEGVVDYLYLVLVSILALLFHILCSFLQYCLLTRKYRKDINITFWKQLDSIILFVHTFTCVHLMQLHVKLSTKRWHKFELYSQSRN